MALRDWLNGVDRDAPPETWLDDVARELDDDESIIQAKIADMTATQEAAAAEIQALKSRNYDLIDAIPQGGGNSDPDPDPSNNPDEPTVDDIVDKMKGSR